MWIYIYVYITRFEASEKHFFSLYETLICLERHGRASLTQLPRVIRLVFSNASFGSSPMFFFSFLPSSRACEGRRRRKTSRMDLTPKSRKAIIRFSRLRRRTIFSSLAVNTGSESHAHPPIVSPRSSKKPLLCQPEKRKTSSFRVELAVSRQSEKCSIVDVVCFIGVSFFVQLPTRQYQCVMNNWFSFLSYSSIVAATVNDKQWMQRHTRPVGAAPRPTSPRGQARF